MRRFIVILLQLSGLILTLHSIIPHIHDEDAHLPIRFEAPQNADFIDLLLGLITNDHGEGHLEDFITENEVIDLEGSLEFLSANLTTLAFFKDIGQTISNLVVDNSLLGYHDLYDPGLAVNQSRGLRAPPYRI